MNSGTTKYVNDNTIHKYKKYKNKYIKLKKQIKLKSTIILPHNKQSHKHNMMQSVDYINYVENVSEPWFTLISLGLKTIEGRKNRGKFKDMQIGEIIEWTNSDFKPRNVFTRIVKKNTYKTFKEYLETEGLDKCLPGIPSIEHGLSVYYKYYTKEDENEFGVVAIGLEKIEL